MYNLIIGMLPHRSNRGPRSTPRFEPLQPNSPQQREEKHRGVYTDSKLAQPAETVGYDATLRRDHRPIPKPHRTLQLVCMQSVSEGSSHCEIQTNLRERHPRSRQGARRTRRAAVFVATARWEHQIPFPFLAFPRGPPNVCHKHITLGVSQIPHTSETQWTL